MRVEWDEEKRAANLRKHGIDFVGAEAVFAEVTVTIEDDRLEYGERRFVTFGVLKAGSSLSSTPSGPMSYGLSR